MNIKIMCWNCKGAGHSRFHSFIKNIVRNYPNLLCLLETRVSGIRADGIIANLGYLNSFRVKANGFAGGIWVCWNEDLFVDILNIHSQVIHVKLKTSHNSKHFFCSIVYASP